MTRIRGLATLPVAALTVVALLTGGLGTAAADGLSKGAVKKIAGKVVAKKASTLSVASATTATTAATATNTTNLAGRPASAYLSSAYTYKLPGLTSTGSEVDVTFPGLPSGTYLVNYSVFADDSTGHGVGCQLIQDTSDNEYLAVAYSSVSGFGHDSVIGSGIFTTTAVSGPILECFGQASNNFDVNTTATVDSTVTFTRLDSVTSGTVGALRAQARPAHHAGAGAGH
jgi:hypothetical protein